MPSKLCDVCYGFWLALSHDCMIFLSPCNLFAASAAILYLLTHMLICTNTVSCLKMNLDALFFRLKTVCNKKTSIFVGEN